MENLQNIVIALLSVLMLIQSIVFIWSANDNLPVWKGYVAAWGKTLHAVRCIFITGKTIKERREAVVVLGVVMVLCVPGAVVVFYAVGQFAH